MLLFRWPYMSLSDLGRGRGISLSRYRYVLVDRRGVNTILSDIRESMHSLSASFVSSARCLLGP